MPRVHLKTKRAAGKRPYICDTCREIIEPGVEYYTWSFRYGGTRFRHKDHGYPRPSELTQAKTASILAAIEAEEDGWHQWETEEDAQQAAQNIAEVAREIASEYEEAAEAFGGAGENQERYEMLDAYADELESWQPPYQADYKVDDKDDDSEVDMEAWREAAQNELPTDLPF